MSEGFPGGPVLKNPPVMQETQVQSPGWKDPLEEGMAIHSSVLAWRAAIQGVTKSQTWLKLLSTHAAGSEGGGLCEKNRTEDECRRSRMVGLANRNRAQLPRSTQNSQDVHPDLWLKTSMGLSINIYAFHVLGYFSGSNTNPPVSQASFIVVLHQWRIRC